MNRNGLSMEEVVLSRKRYGSNNIEEGKKRGFGQIFLETFGDPIIKILLIALVVKVVFLFRDSNWFETIGILVAVLLSSLVSSISEYGSEEAFKKLQEIESNIKVKVRRDGVISEVEVADLVVGDVMILQSGDAVGADGEVIYGKVLIDESKLNGESKEKNKSVGTMVYRGTTIYEGSCEVLVRNVGGKTLYGKMAAELQSEKVISPLKERLTGLAKIISRIGYIGSLLVTFSYMFSVVVINNHFDIHLIIETIRNVSFMANHLIYALTLAVTIIVVAVPEGLPMMITLVLSSNMKRMMKSNVLVRKLVGIETTGSMNILFTDKTGTLTKGNLSVISVCSGNGKIYHDIHEIEKYSKYYEIFGKSITWNNEGIINSKGEVIGGNYTDRALLKFWKRDVFKCNKVNQVPFDSKRKYSSVSVIDNGSVITYVKGACEALVDKCKYYVNQNGEEEEINLNLINEMIYRNTSKGARVIGLFYTKGGMDELVFVGLVSLKDEIRSEAKEAIKRIEGAGIQVVMITGDAKETAYAIAKDLGIINYGDLCLTCEELNNYTDYEIIKLLPRIKVVARALPTLKSRLVNIAINNNYIVGMTGDGVNDAPALKKANVGFAMGSGTEVAKEASDIVILDDNIMSISEAILYGRTIFKSIRKFIIYQLTCNFCALFLSIVGPFIGVNTPITIVQMLWINMIMDTFAGLAFSYEPPLLDSMSDKPKKRSEPIINKYMYSEIILTGGYSALLCLLFLKSNIISSLIRPSIDNEYLLTAYFALFIFIGICNAFNARTNRLNILAHLKDNKVFVIIFLFIMLVQIVLIYQGGVIFRTFGLTPFELVLVMIMSFSVIPFDMLRKIVLKKFNKDVGV